jgi:hypothetical protein
MALLGGGAAIQSTPHTRCLGLAKGKEGSASPASRLDGLQNNDHACLPAQHITPSHLMGMRTSAAAAARSAAVMMPPAGQGKAVQPKVRLSCQGATMPSRLQPERWAAGLQIGSRALPAPAACMSSARGCANLPLYSTCGPSSATAGASTRHTAAIVRQRTTCQLHRHPRQHSTSCSGSAGSLLAGLAHLQSAALPAGAACSRFRSLSVTATGCPPLSKTCPGWLTIAAGQRSGRPR